MPLHALFDSTVLVSAFLHPNGVAGVLLDAATQRRYLCSFATDILTEVRHTLAYPRIQARYHYSAEDAATFCDALAGLFPLVSSLPTIAAVSRDPNDDFIVACAVAARATHLVTRDKDLLVLGSYEGIAILSPEAFITLLRTEHLL